MNQKDKKKKTYHANVNVNWMIKNVTQIKSGKTINVGVSVKIIKKHHVSE